MKTLKQFVSKTQKLADSLNDKNWDQSEGTYSPNFRCCIGAHLANLFRDNLDPVGGWLDYERGQAAAARYIGCTVEQLGLLLHAAGAPVKPFGGNRWPLHPAFVWQNLKRIEELPPEDATAVDDWLHQYHEQFNITHRNA